MARGADWREDGSTARAGLKFFRAAVDPYCPFRRRANLNRLLRTEFANGVGDIRATGE
jgi:hypothetical protein